MSGDDQTASLVVRAQQGDAAAFDELVRAYLRVAYSVALSVVSRPSDAEDVAQDAMLRAFQHIHTCREPGRFAGWLLQIVRNQARNWLDRRRWRDVPAEERSHEQPGTDESPESAAERRQLLAALALLGPAQREVLLLHDLEGWTHCEIAAAVGISEVMSRQHLFRARRELRAKLGTANPAEVDHG